MECINSKILLLTDNEWKLFESYKQYREYRETGKVTLAAPGTASKKSEEKKNEAESLLSQKELRAFRAKERERKAYIDKRIEELEISVDDLTEQINSPEVASDHTKLSELYIQLEESKAELNSLSDEWLLNYSDD